MILFRKMSSLLGEKDVSVNEVKELAAQMSECDLNMTDHGTGLLYDYLNRHDDPKIVEALIDAGVRFNHTQSYNEDYTPVVCCIRNRKIEILKVLIKKGVDLTISSKGETPLNYAVKLNDVEIVKILLEGGANPNLAGDCYCTPLDLCNKFQRETIKKLLLKFGAYP